MKNVALLVAIGVDQDGYRQVLGMVEVLGEFYPESDWQRCMTGIASRLGCAAGQEQGVMVMLKAVTAKVY